MGFARSFWLAFGFWLARSVCWIALELLGIFIMMKKEEKKEGEPSIGAASRALQDLCNQLDANGAFKHERGPGTRFGPKEEPEPITPPTPPEVPVEPKGPGGRCPRLHAADAG